MCLFLFSPTVPHKSVLPIYDAVQKTKYKIFEVISFFLQHKVLLQRQGDNDSSFKGEIVWYFWQRCPPPHNLPLSLSLSLSLSSVPSVQPWKSSFFFVRVRDLSSFSATHFFLLCVCGQHRAVLRWGTLLSRFQKYSYQNGNLASTWIFLLTYAPLRVTLNAVVCTYVLVTS